MSQYPKDTELIVGLMGKKDHGKTAVAEYLIERHDFGAIAFADPLKRKLSELLNIPLEKFYPTNKEAKIYRETVKIQKVGKTIRQLMQFYGDGCRTMFYKEIWIDAMDKMLKERFFGMRLAISDVRYVNEADYIKKHGGFIIKIIDYRRGGGDLHRSEIEQDLVGPPFFTVVNDGTLEDLFAKIDKVLEMILDE